MLKVFILLLIIVPAMEIWLFVLSGKIIGVIPTLLLIISTGLIGAWLAKRQGLETIIRAQEQLRNGKVPGEAILDGICILAGGIFLVTPGFITDFLGFLLLFPYTRKSMKKLLIKLLKRWIDRGSFFIIRR